MKQATKRFFSMILGAMFLICALLIYMCFVKPEYDAATLVRADLFAKREFANREQSTNEKVKTLITDYRDGSSGVREVIAATLPVSLDYSEIVSQVSGLAKNSNLTLKSIAFSVLGNAKAKTSVSGPVQDDASIIKPLGTVHATLELQGSYENIKRLIESLEKNMRIFEVTHISIDPGVQKGGGVSFTYKLEVVTYYQAK